jgi:hypothetical protein
MTGDPINSPAHYASGEIECIDATRAALGSDAFVAHCRATALKYIWRCGKKDDALQDLRKAAWYINRAIRELECGRPEVKS